MDPLDGDRGDESSEKIYSDPFWESGKIIKESNMSLVRSITRLFPFVALNTVIAFVHVNWTRGKRTVMTSPAGKPATIVKKARRKISLPWFRQSSVTPPHAALSRQHTIDTPSSFQARLLHRQPSLSQVLEYSFTHINARSRTTISPLDCT